MYWCTLMDQTRNGMEKTGIPTPKWHHLTWWSETGISLALINWCVYSSNGWCEYHDFFLIAAHTTNGGNFLFDNLIRILQIKFFFYLKGKKCVVIRKERIHIYFIEIKMPFGMEKTGWQVFLWIPFHMRYVRRKDGALTDGSIHGKKKDKVNLPAENIKNDLLPYITCRRRLRKLTQTTTQNKTPWRGWLFV